MNIRLLAFSALALFAAGCGREVPVGDVPEGFYYRGAPVDPSCFLDTTAQLGDNAISLNVCTGKNKAQPEYKEDHFYGVEIADAAGTVSPPYVYYRYLGEVDGYHVIQTISSGGGAAQMSSLRMVSLEGDLLKTYKRVAGGDRCNGGITKASVVGSAIKYTRNITALDLPNLTKGTEANFRRNDLRGDAATCLGTATYEDDKLQSVTLSLNPAELEGRNTAKGECFLSVYNDWFKPERVLDERDIENFGMDLNNKCGELGR